MRPPDKMKTPAGRRALGEAAVQRASDGRKITAHGATVIDQAALMLDYARCPRTQFHAHYFATMAVKLLQPLLLGDAADSRARSLRLQAVGEPGRGGVWS